jgi:hypothetical protein
MFSSLVSLNICFVTCSGMEIDSVSELSNSLTMYLLLSSSIAKFNNMSIYLESDITYLFFSKNSHIWSPNTEGKVKAIDC